MPVIGTLIRHLSSFLSLNITSLHVCEVSAIKMIQIFVQYFEFYKCTNSSPFISEYVSFMFWHYHIGKGHPIRAQVYICITETLDKRVYQVSSVITIREELQKCLFFKRKQIFTFDFCSKQKYLHCPHFSTKNDYVLLLVRLTFLTVFIPKDCI